jgi:hypothetical protein
VPADHRGKEGHCWLCWLRAGSPLGQRGLPRRGFAPARRARLRHWQGEQQQQITPLAAAPSRCPPGAMEQYGQPGQSLSPRTRLSGAVMRCWLGTRRYRPPGTLTGLPEPSDYAGLPATRTAATSASPACAATMSFHNVVNREHG